MPGGPNPLPEVQHPVTGDDPSPNPGGPDPAVRGALGGGAQRRLARLQWRLEDGRLRGDLRIETPDTPT